ncbi:GAF domain-containing protein [Salinarchaeum sp. IM2453]|uniref:sensor histidine kinase n=1 Tax=Salinarchaeum sp. IM2453 TaxID=2862870 RepID=UPI001C8349A5|nr:ATP-binding protein [Salinarchaeum sp. IM2453]QZA87633.1 GAF domain-containing protein [Salinarchaeum sp. IM2453]
MAEKISYHILYAGPDSSVVTQILSPPYRVSNVDTLSEAVTAIDHNIDNLVLSDKAYDQDTIDEILAEWPTLPIVLYTDHVTEQLIQEALHGGCQDVVFKNEQIGEDKDPLRKSIDRLYRQSISDVADTVLDASRSLTMATPEELGGKIEWSLQSIGTRIDADHCVVYDYVGTDLLPTHHWQRANQAPVETVSEENLPGFKTVVQRFKAVVVDGPVTNQSMGISLLRNETEAITADQQTQEYLDTYNLNSMLAVPIVVDWKLEGVLVVGRSDTWHWPAKVRRQLRVFGELIGYAQQKAEQRKELEAKNNRLERFSSVIAHDLRNPLNVIEGYADLIEETRNVDHIKDINEATNRMEVMLNELLELARGGEEITDTEVVQIEEVATDAWESVDTKQAVLETEDIGTVRADRTRLQQVFENLYRNAIEHVGADVTIQVEKTNSGFAIEDNGPGIAEEKQETVFDEGYTGAGGTGLGLAIVKTVIEAHGWTIEVTDGANLGGARFVIETEQLN